MTEAIRQVESKAIGTASQAGFDLPSRENVEVLFDDLLSPIIQKGVIDYFSNYSPFIHVREQSTGKLIPTEETFFGDPALVRRTAKQSTDLKSAYSA